MTTNARASIFPIIGIICAWGVLISQVRFHWGGESYYNFGWFVPMLALWLLIKNLQHIQPLAVVSPAKTLAFASLCALFVLPVHALSEVNPFWRLPLWIQAIGLAAFTAAGLYQTYGKRGLRAGMFPLFFLLTMIPWPYRVEVFLVQGLTNIVVIIALKGLHVIGYPVLLAGNSLTLGDLNIGVNEACSGIRSLQALFMVTLFLGSLFGQGIKRRILALLILPIIVIVINSARAIFLSLQVIVNGNIAYDKWHDTAGYIAFGISMILIYVCIELLNIGSKAPKGNPPNPIPIVIGHYSWKPMRLSLIGFAALPLIMFLIVEGWFRFHETRQSPPAQWSLLIPDSGSETSFTAEIHPQIEALLGYSFGYRFFQRLPSQAFLEIYFYGYTPDNKLASVSSYGHSPEICMEATGATMTNRFDNLDFREAKLHLPLQHYLFELPSRNKVPAERMHIFWVVAENRSMGIQSEDLQSLNYRAQFVQLFRGRRDFSRQVLLISYRGAGESSTARREVLGFLSENLQID